MIVCVSATLGVNAQDQKSISLVVDFLGQPRMVLFPAIYDDFDHVNFRVKASGSAFLVSRSLLDSFPILAYILKTEPRVKEGLKLDEKCGSHQELAIKSLQSPRNPRRNSARNKTKIGQFPSSPKSGSNLCQPERMRRRRSKDRRLRDETNSNLRNTRAQGMNLIETTTTVPLASPWTKSCSN